jgi:hypothetical protein
LLIDGKARLSEQSIADKQILVSLLSPKGQSDHEALDHTDDLEAHVGPDPRTLESQ